MAAEPVPVAAEPRPSKRRRTAAEVAQVEAQQQAERAAELAALELERPIVHEPEPQPTQSLEERARALFRDLPAATAQPDEEAGAAVAEPAATSSAESAPAPRRAPFIPPRIQRPAPAGGMGRGAGNYPAPAQAGLQQQRARGPAGPPSTDRGGPPARQFGPDAEKGGGRKKGKKGKRSMVDQEAVQANILRTLQSIKGAPPAGRARAAPTSRPIGAGRRPAGGGKGRGKDPHPGQRVHLGRPSSPRP